jgi:hypothetical protein|tara:strand:+ start:720 stop:896 length:177 start_codon:yes stop_codon:yes gene_type:complete
MILYTEKQLSEAYGKFIKKLPLVVEMPTREEFRPIYEESMRLRQVEDWLEWNGDIYGE